MISKNIFYAASVCANILFIAGIAYVVSQPDLHYASPNREGKESYSVAIFLPASHPAMDEINKGFVQTLEREVACKVRVTTFNANGNKTLLRAQSEEIINGDYDLVFTIGAACTQTMKELTTKKQIALPIVFGAVGDPVGMHIVASLESSGNHVSGVYESRNYKQQLEFLKMLKPNCKSVLLVFDPSSIPYFEQDKDAIARECSALGFQFQALQVYNPNEISQKVPSLLDSADTLLILKDHTTVGALDNLIKLCSLRGITLYASDLNSGAKGAALSYGVREEDTGIAAAQVAKEILNGKLPADIPLAAVQPLKIALNTKVMREQGLDVPSDKIDLMAFGEVV